MRSRPPILNVREFVEWLRNSPDREIGDFAAEILASWDEDCTEDYWELVDALKNAAPEFSKRDEPFEVVRYLENRVAELEEILGKATEVAKELIAATAEKPLEYDL